MKTVGVTALMAGAAMAWPMNMDMITGGLQADAQAKWLEARDMLENSIAERQAIASPQGAGALPLTPPPFDAKAQYVSNQGDHKFIAPGPGDERGECPGLNAMANHGYIPRNGRATIQQFINGTETVFGMAKDLGGFLAIFGAVVDGDGSSWSIGGLPHTGILGSHNNYETDSSPIKSDLNQYGSNTKFVMSQFMNLYNRQPNAATANYNLDVLRQFRKDRFTESINKNPYFAYLPFGGIEVSQAAFTFIYRFMSNKSAENPEGILNKNVLKSFMSVTGPENNLKHTPGYERIPDNWYKRNPSDEYSITYFQTDILYLAEADPRILSVGCNKGKVNTYSPIDPATLTGGAYTAQQIAANPLCFATAFTKAEIPLITGLQLTNPLVAPLVSALNTATSGMNCAAIGAVNQSALTACPGFSFYGGPSGPVAPGAIQS
ncbi:Dothistromin biosynthesis peroxidase dotB [Pseudocercospora fuligena]|uniref:Dothistromin biosynthesis peroxidase dotB n=1 Tax=Pseudocercospora fuligena TaxID=685502 RepID=A0A8H6RIG9_9PEZI|nr:Dothistromin biosynthesis peroxidase dotB [Pseudocercospora fuligena]